MAKTFIPEVWSARTLAHLDKDLVYADVVNRDYEGEIKQFGDKVHINQIGDITVESFTGELSAAEDLDISKTTLTIDQSLAFNFKVSDIDAAQSKLELVDNATRRAAYSVADKVDKYIASLVTEAGVKVGTSAAPVLVNESNIYDTLVDIGVELSKNNVSKFKRFIVLPPELVGLLAKDRRFIRKDEVLENGLVSAGKVAGFDIRESNNVPVTAGKFSVAAGTSEAISYAGQISSIEGYRPEGGFSDAVKGLFVYGAKVVQPKALAHAILKIGEETTEG